MSGQKGEPIYRLPRGATYGTSTLWAANERRRSEQPERRWSRRLHQGERRARLRGPKPLSAAHERMRDEWPERRADLSAPQGGEVRAYAGQKPLSAAHERMRNEWPERRADLSAPPGAATYGTSTLWAANERRRSEQPERRWSRRLHQGERRTRLRGRSGAPGGADRDRTDDLLNAIQALSQLSYGPTAGRGILGLRGAGVNARDAPLGGQKHDARRRASRLFP